MKTSALLLAIVLVMCSTGSALADVPTTINIQGRLTDSTGAPKVGDMRFNFKIFDDATAGGERWPRATDEEAHVVPVDSGGLWNAVLGKTYPIEVDVFSDSSLWLEIIVDDGKIRETLPRVKLQTGPFTFVAARSQVSDLAQGLSPNTVRSGQIVDGAIGLDDIGQNGAAKDDVMKWDGSNWVTSRDQGLTVVGSSNIVNGSIALIDIGQNAADSGDVMKWDGTQWAVSPDIGVAGDFVERSGDTMTGDLTLVGIDDNEDILLHGGHVGSMSHLTIRRNATQYGKLTGGGSGEGPLLSLTLDDHRRAILGSGVGDFSYFYMRNSADSDNLVRMETNTGGGTFSLSDSSGTSRMSFLAGSWWKADMSVQLPDSAIASPEIMDEPGVAQAIDSIGTMYLTGGAYDLLTQSIYCPNDGFVMVIASTQLKITHSSGTTSTVEIGVSETSESLTAEQNRHVEINSAAASITTTEIVTVQKVFSVNKGTRTFYFIADKISGAVTHALTKQTMSCVYFPTAYGTISE